MAREPSRSGSARSWRFCASAPGGQLESVESRVPVSALRADPGARGDGREHQWREAATRNVLDRDRPHPRAILFEERIIQFVSKKTTLDGILTVPAEGQPIPYRAVLFLQGSGPLDRDGTVGPNRPFFELARALAVQGIASFRYDKRTLAAPATLDPRR